jgi:hypothetical protein
MRRALARRLAAVSAVGLFVLASCELIMLVLLFLLSEVDNPFVFLEDFYVEDGIVYVYYEYADGSYELVAVRGTDIYSQRFDDEGNLIEVVDNWPGPNPNPLNPFFPGFVDPAEEGLATGDMQTSTAKPGTPRGRSDASRGNPDDQKKEESSSPPPDSIPSEGSSTPDG